MAATTYGSSDASAVLAGRYGAAQKPLQVLISFADFLLIIASGLLAGFTYHQIALGAAGGADVYAGASLIIAAVFVLSAHVQGMYGTRQLLDMRWQFRKVTLTWLFALAILSAVAFLLKSTEVLSRGTILVFSASGLVVLLLHRAVWRYGLTSALAKGQLRDRRVALLSLKPLDFTSSRFKDLRKNGFDVIQHFVISGQSDNEDWQRQMQELLGQTREANLDEYLLAIDWNELAILPQITQFLRVVPQPVRLLSDLTVADLASRPFFSVSTTIAIELQRPPLSLFERAQKRFLDVTLASLALLMLSPLMVIVSCLIKFDSAGKVIFRQSRRGFNGKPFDIWKFRSMTVAENGTAVIQARKQDARVTRVGRVLRKTSIDELPQLWNVLRGEMSLVGPRPHAIAHDIYYDEMIDNYVFRHHMKPGLTGWAQINGFRGETPTIDLMEKRVDYDVWYVNNWTIWLDLRIIVRTAIALFGQEAY